VQAAARERGIVESDTRGDALTREDGDRLLRPSQTLRKKPEQWVIKTEFPRPIGRSSLSFSNRFYGTAYWGARSDGSLGLTPYRGNAKRYFSKNDALYAGYELKEARRIGDFEVEKIQNPRS
jgi:hypothetical protein